MGHPLGPRAPVTKENVREPDKEWRPTSPARASRTRKSQDGTRKQGKLVPPPPHTSPGDPRRH
ncbi:hypothetical protein PAL_GLEAN10022898 [Pteropus alecto]|uniref:Uncharacterized protein n=1 Tax=Pteropus alecto TaxID=9402 RepID=L5K7U9_PTEAL|nr:hypothetical protein PAL_GLEAN10022898 [Pteropus alecto]